MGYVPEAVQVAQRPGNYADISLWGKKRIMKYIRPRHPDCSTAEGFIRDAPRVLLSIKPIRLLLIFAPNRSFAIMACH